MDLVMWLQTPCLDPQFFRYPAQDDPEYLITLKQICDSSWHKVIDQRIEKLLPSVKDRANLKPVPRDIVEKYMLLRYLLNYRYAYFSAWCSFCFLCT
jgi:hypothetical protein